MNRDKLVLQLFTGKVSRIIGNEKTLELLKDCFVAFPKHKHECGGTLQEFYVELKCDKCGQTMADRRVELMGK